MNKKLLVFIALVAIIVVGFLGFWYYTNINFSKEILTLQISGPATSSMGAQVQYTVTYKNNGNFVLQSPQLVFQLPDNSLTGDGITRFSQTLKDIYPGQQGSAQFSARLLGKEGDTKTAQASLSYIPKNLSARYESDTSFATTIDAVPITLDYDLPATVETGKEFSYDINYFSNVDYPLENLSVMVDAVSGLSVESAVPASLDNIEWKLSTLNKAQGGRITITGLVTAGARSNLNFSAHLGMWQDGTFITIKDVTQQVQVINPLLVISEQINGSADYVASPGRTLHYQLFFQNTGSTPFANITATATLAGGAFDFSTLKSGQGQAAQNTGVITWSPAQAGALQNLAPGQTASVDFYVTLKNNWVPSDAQENSLVLKNNVSAGGVSQEFDTKINSNLELFQEAYYSTQVGIENSGPIPPQVGQTTTYSINWQIKNLLSNVNNVTIKATLPQGVNLVDTIWPDSQAPNFSFDSASRQIVWVVGNVSAGAGVTSAPPSLFFQVALNPAASLQGSVASLIGQATVSGQDQVTNATISSVAPAVTTALPDDAASSGGGVVQ